MAKLLNKKDFQSRIEHFYKILFKFIVFFIFYLILFSFLRFLCTFASTKLLSNVVISLFASALISGS